VLTTYQIAPAHRCCRPDRAPFEAALLCAPFARQVNPRPGELRAAWKWLSAVIELSGFTVEEVLIQFRNVTWKGPVSTPTGHCPVTRPGCQIASHQVLAGWPDGTLLPSRPRPAKDRFVTETDLTSRIGCFLDRPEAAGHLIYGPDTQGSAPL